MKAKVIVFFASLLCLFSFSGRALTETAAAPCSDPAEMPTAAVSFAPLHFIPNLGQSDVRALFRTDASGYVLWLTREGMTFSRAETDRNGRAARSVSRLTFIGANKDCEVIAADPSDYRVSYFYGRDESEWQTDIPTSRAVLYKNLYDGIDLKVYGTGREVEYDWIIEPGADARRIRFHYEGGPRARLDEDGHLAIETPGGRILHRKPSAYQVIEGRKVEVEAVFAESADGSFGFALGAFDPSRELTIDPLVLAYSTYLGGSQADIALGVATDAAGALYVWGVTSSKDFPPGSQTLPRDDYFITKMSSDGKTLVYSAFFPRGGSTAEGGGIRVDAKGFVYFAATTESNRFPLKNPFQAAFAGGQSDGFILKLSRDGRSLVFSSYIGGRSYDSIGDIAVDASGAAYLAGRTGSPDFPTAKPAQKKLRGDHDAFVAKVAPDGKSLQLSTYLGGTAQDEAIRIAVDASGAAVVAGETQSRDFPVNAAVQKIYAGGKNDNFFAKLAPDGGRFLFCSYLGGNRDDYLGGLALDESGAIYVAGTSNGSFPVKNAFQKARKGRSDVVLTKVDAKGNALVYSTYLGGEGSDGTWGIAVDGSGAVYVSGWTASRNFPLKTPFQSRLRGSEDGFLTVLDPSGLKLAYSTFLGGSLRDRAQGLCLGPDGSVCLVGMTPSLDFPVKNAYQLASAGGDDAFILRLQPATGGR